MKLAPIVRRLQSEGPRGFGYRVEAIADVRRDKRLIQKQRRTASGGSSITDAGDYPTFCQVAADDEKVFARFRRSAIYMQVLEHVSKEQGSGYLREIEKHPDVMAKLRNVVSDDKLGGPRNYRYPGYGLVSPTTLRYVKVATDLNQLFGSLDGLRMAEIGVGYGGQCRVIMSTWSVASYELIDLQEALALTRRFLDGSKLDLTPVVERDSQLSTHTDVDLVISNYAFSELRRDVQEAYLDTVIRNAARGYVTYNHISPPELRSMSAKEFAAMIPDAQILPEKPKTAEGNVIVAWGME